MIRFDIAGRRAGKTTRAMALFRKHEGSLYIVHNSAYRTQLIEEYNLNPNEAARILVARHLEVQPTRRHVKHVIIDNLDIEIGHLLTRWGIFVEEPPYVTATGEIAK
jgi:hypothetical protein